MKKRRGTIDFFKSVFAFIITAYHAESFFLVGNDHLCGCGFIAVEFFFIVSGYLLAEKAARDNMSNIWDGNVRMIIHKIGHIFPYILLAALTANLFYIAGNFSIPLLARNVVLSTVDIFGLQMLGFRGYYATGVAWYISSLFAFSFMIYPILCKKREMFCKYMAPLTAFLIYGFISARVGNLNGPGIWWTFIYQGLLRGYAGMALGCTAYELKKWLDHRNHSIWYGVLEIAGYGITIAYAIFHPTADIYDFLIVPCIFLSIAVSFSEHSILETVFEKKTFNLMGAFSMSLFLNHYFVKENLPRYFPGMERHQMLFVYYAIVILLTVLNFILGNWLSKGKKIWKYTAVAIGFILLAASVAVLDPFLFV